MYVQELVEIETTNAITSNARLTLCRLKYNVVEVACIEHKGSPSMPNESEEANVHINAKQSATGPRRVQ